MILAGLFLVSALQLGEAQACHGEAQLIARVLQTKKLGLSTCLAFIDLTQVRFYAASAVCPLDLDAIATQGVSIGFKDGHDCSLDVGSELNGVIVASPTGTLSLE